MKQKLLAIKAMEKILKDSGAKRVALNAKKALMHELEEYAEKIASMAVKFAKHAKRNTVKPEDIKLAFKNI